MSDRRYTAIFGAAVLTAGAATFSVYRMLDASAAPQREPTQAVVVVGRDVPAGMPVPREALSQVLWPSRIAPPGAFASVDSVAGRVARVALTQGEPVRPASLAPRGAAPGLEGTITPDRRAIAVRVSEAAGVSGLLRPGSRVDVLVTGRGDGSGAPPTARLVMADVRVLGVGSARPVEAKASEKTGGDAPPPASIASIVTLEVTPAQAQQLAAAEGQGTIQVVLRGFDGAAGQVASGVEAEPAAAAGMTNLGALAEVTHTGLAVQPTHRATPRASAAPRRTPSTTRVAAAAPTLASAPPRPDSATVRVYRNGQLTVLRVEVSAPVPPEPVPAPVPALVGLRTAAIQAAARTTP